MSLRLMLEEAPALLTPVLGAMGFRQGTLDPALRMVLWAEIFQGQGFAYLDALSRDFPTPDPERITLVEESDHHAVLDAGGQSALLAGPLALEIAAAKAREKVLSLVAIRNLGDSYLLGQLAQAAAGLGLTCRLGYQVAPGTAEAQRLARISSSGRVIAALPAPLPSGGKEDAAPLWLDVPGAPAGLGRMLEQPAEALADLSPAAYLTPDSSAGETGAAIGASLVLHDLPAVARDDIAACLRDYAAAIPGARLLEPAAVAALHERARQEGLEISEALRESLIKTVQKKRDGLGEGSQPEIRNKPEAGAA